MSELKHYGVLGMKWGIRKGSKKKVRKIIPSEDYKTAKVLKGKKMAEMSNKDLETLIRRVQLERNYSKLAKPVKTKGRKFAEDFIDSSAKMLANQLRTQGLKKIMVSAVKLAARKRKGL